MTKVKTVIIETVKSDFHYTGKRAEVAAAALASINQVTAPFIRMAFREDNRVVYFNVKEIIAFEIAHEDKETVQ